MDVELIKTVLDVARLKSFSAAAFSVPCSQSTVSRRVEAVEDELGIRIFARPARRGSRNVELTPGGEKVVAAMVKMLDAYAEFYSVVEEAANAEASVFNLGIRSNLMPPMGVSLMKLDYFEEFPGRNISVRTDSFIELLNEFRTGRLDAILFSSAVVDAEKLLAGKDAQLTKLGTTRFSVGISELAPLSQKSSVSLWELRNETFLLDSSPGTIIPGITFSNKRRLISACREAGFEPHIREIPSSMLEIRYSLALEGRGICPSYSPKPWRQIEGLHHLTVDDNKLSVDYYLLHSAGRKSREIRTFINFFARRLNAQAMQEGETP